MENFNRRVDQLRRTSVIVPNLKRFNYHHLPPTIEIKEEESEESGDEYNSIKIRSLKKPCTSNRWSTSSVNFNPFPYDRRRHCLAGEDEVQIYCKKCTRDFNSLQSYLVHLYHPPSSLHYPTPTLHLFSDTCNTTNISEKTTTTTTKTTTSRVTKNPNKKQKRMKSILQEKNQNQQPPLLLPQIPVKSIPSEPSRHDEEEVEKIDENEAVVEMTKDTLPLPIKLEEEMEITNEGNDDESNKNNNNEDTNQENVNTAAGTNTDVADVPDILPKQENVIFKCPDCDQLLKNENGLKAHRVIIETVKCPAPTCSLTFDLRCLFKQHVLTCPALPSHKKKSQRSKYYLNANIKKIETDSSFLCPYNDCRAKISTQLGLEHHIQKHVEERSHMCEHCGMGFYTRGALSRHVAHIHSNERPYKCDICGAGFKGSGTLSKHKIIHMNVRKHECPQCGRAFKTTDALNVHLRLHSDIRMFNCEICKNIGFNHKVTLKRHYAKYHAEFTVQV